MQWFLDLKIAKKVQLFSVLTIAFIFLVGLAGYICNLNASNSIKELYESKLIGMQSIISFQNNFNAIKSNVFQLMLTTNNSENQKLIDDIASRRKQNNEFLKAFKSASPDEYELEQFEKLNDALKRYRVLSDRTSALALRNKNAEAYAYFSANQQAAIDVRDIVRSIVSHDKESAKKLYEQNKKDSAFANTTIISAILLALIISVSFSSWMIKMLDTRFKVLVDLANRLADGDMTVNAKILAQDEIGVTGTAINNAAAKLRTLIRDIHTSVQEISASSEEMSASSDQTAQGAQQTANSTQQLAQGSQEIANDVQHGAKTVTDVNSYIQGISKEAEIAAKLGDNTEVNANSGSEYVQKAIVKIDSIKNVSSDISVTIEDLGRLSSEIETIVDLIKNIAGQTNLLALNAAIEAARAGEHGKGFAVVADEVKKLAGDSASATEKITGMIKEIQSKTHDAVNKMEKATTEVEEGVLVVTEVGGALETIISEVKETNQKIQVITKEVDKVAGNSEDLVKMIENISAITEETAASAEEISSITEEQTASMEEISASAQSLAKIAENLNNQVSVFKV